MSAPTQEQEPSAAIDRAASVLKATLAALRGVPTLLTWILWGSLAAGLFLAWFWFLRHESMLVKWLAAPWLVVVAVPQAGLWFLTSSIKELFALPERLLALKSGLTDQGEYVLKRIRRVEAEEVPEGGFLTKLREAYALHGELGQIVATRAILHRFTGPMAVVIGPISFLLNCAIIAVGVLQLAIAAL